MIGIRELNRERLRLNLKHRELAGMIGMNKNTFISKMLGYIGMTESEQTRVVNAMYELKKGGQMTVNTQMMTHARAALFNYAKLLRKWQEVLFLIQATELATDYSAQGYGVFPPSGGNTSDPVAKRYARLETLNKAAENGLNRIKEVIEERAVLKNSGREDEREMFQILERHFCFRESIEDIALSLRKSPRTMYRRKYELVRRIGARMSRKQSKSGRKSEE